MEMSLGGQGLGETGNLGNASCSCAGVNRTEITKTWNSNIIALEEAGSVASIDGIFLPPTALLLPYVEQGVRKCTTNPSIFKDAISNSSYFDARIKELAACQLNAEEITWQLMVETVKEAADLLHPAYVETKGRTGFVSLELHPDYAKDVAASLKQAESLSRRVNKENLFIKVPATEPGLEVIKGLVSKGQHVNVTLIFSEDQLRAVNEACVQGLEAAPPKLRKDVQIVLSLFVSRPGREIDELLKRPDHGLTNDEVNLFKSMKPETAHAKLCYAAWQEVFEGERFLALRGKANVPRMLWASLKANDASKPLEYVLPLVGKDTVFTIPQGTLDMLLAAPDGTIQRDTVLENMDEARKVVRLAREKIALDSILTRQIQKGCDGFSTAFHTLIESVAAKMPQMN